MSPVEMPATVDRISDLPDEILCHILSFLPTKLAYATSVLSKRWTPLCHSLTALRFDDEAVRDVLGFVRFGDFVDAVTLSARVQHQPIETFHLKGGSPLWGGLVIEGGSQLWGAGPVNINEWVEAAKRRRVENLQVSMKRMSMLPPSIFSCRTLVVLKLKRLCVAGSLCSVDLPSLKTLHLRHVCFQDRKDLKELLSACPVLEELQIVVGCFRLLEYYKGFPVFPNLIHVELRCHGFLHGWDVAVEMLQHCPKLQILCIKKPKLNRSSYVCKEEDWTYPDSVPESVSSHLRTCSIVNFAGLEEDLRFATYILQNARLLQLMTIRSTRSSYPMEKPQFLEELSSCPRISPTCKLSFESI